MLQGSKADLQPSRPIHGVLPRTACPLGRVALPVTLGLRDDLRTEKITFDMADIDLPYNAIIDRPDINKFMAVPYYAYLMLKIPVPKGVIMERVDAVKAVACLEDILASKLAASEKAEEPAEVGPIAPRTRMSAPAATDTKKIALDAEGSKTTTIGGGVAPT